MDSSEKQKRSTNPMEKANPLSLITFWYTLGLFKKGFKKDLEEDDIYEVIKSCRSKKLGDGTETQWKKTPSIMPLMLRRFGIQYVIICIINILWDETSSILTPLGLSRLIAYFTPHTHITKEQAYGYAGVVIFLKVGAFVVMSNLMAFQTVISMKMHASLKSLLYRKALKLSPCSSSGTNLGNLITLITKDIHIVEFNMWLLKDFLTFFIQFFTIAYLLYNRLGNPAFIGLGLIFFAVPIQGYLSSKLKNIRLKVQVNSDQRLQRTQETLSAIKIIKMYTWEKFFYKRISETRKKEIHKLINVFFINSVNTTLGMIVSKATFLVFIFLYIWLGYSTNTELIFYVLNLFNQLNRQFGFALPLNFSRIAQLYASLSRINKVLKAEEVNKTLDDNAENPMVALKSVSFRLANKDILKNISMNIPKPGLTVVSGTVGSGKSSLLKIVLQDYPVSEGVADVSGSISYASQDPWLFPSTVRQNILFGEEYDEQRYNKVVEVCALRYDFEILEDGDLTIVADKGMNLSKGQQARINLARAVYRQTNIYLFDDSLTALDNHVQDHIFHECILDFLKDKICILVTQNKLHLKEAHNTIILKEGEIIHSGDSSNLYKKAIEDFTVLQNEENESNNNTTIVVKEKKLLETEQQQSKKNIYREVKKQGKVNINIYRKYFEYGGGFIIFACIMVLYVGGQYCDSSAESTLSKWVDFQQKVFDLETNKTDNSSQYQNAVADKDKSFQLYGILTLLRCVFGLVKFYALLRYCQRASIRIHKLMITALIGGTMAFFDTHFLGNILNRFSYDLNNIDEVIPFLFPILGNTIFEAGGSIILITTVNWMFLIPAVVFMVLLIVFRWFLMPTSRSLKRLEAATRSPLVGHINSSLEGVTTIRAFRAEQILKDEFDKYQDLYTSAYMTMRISMMGYGYFMNLFSAIFTTTIIARFLFFDDGTSAGNVGLALTQVFQLTSYLQIGIGMWADLENNMTSVERALEYTTLKQEPKEGDKVENWPSKGSIKFDKVNLCYEGCHHSVLKGISFTVKPQEKIAIVGRTGAGKSSIITVLYRLYEFDGKIEIDGVDTRTVALEYLRKHISIIPQDPVLFTGTIRQNIDPFNEYSDDIIWDVIKKVKMQDIVPTLDTLVENSGANYSSGQKQLFCLARAGIAKRKILVLDEATANMDAETEEILQRVIEETFSDCTIITIAHRLDLILTYDKVLVLDNGNIIEDGNPRDLKANPNSRFHRMCEELKAE